MKKEELKKIYNEIMLFMNIALLPIFLIFVMIVTFFIWCFTKKSWKESFETLKKNRTV